MKKKGIKSLGLGGKETPRVKNSQYHSRKLQQSKSQQDMIEETEEENSEKPVRLQNMRRKNMKK